MQNKKTADEWYEFFRSKDLDYCLLQASCITHNSEEFCNGLLKAINDEHKTPMKRTTAVVRETDPDILRGTHEIRYVIQETGAGKGAKATYAVTCKKDDEEDEKMQE